MVGQYTDISTGNMLSLFTKPQRSVFSISVPESFTVLKLMEPATEARVEDGESMNYPKPIGGEEPSVEHHGDRAVYIFKTTVNGIWFISAEYVSSRAAEDGIDYRVYLFPEHEEMLNETMDLAQRIIKFYSEKYYPYPLKEFRVVETPWEYNTNRANDRHSTSLISFGMGELIESLGVELNESVKNYINVLYTAVHETSHFWFGELVASKALNEGSAVFSELLFTESFDPELGIELRKYYTSSMLNDSDWQNASFANMEWGPRTQGIRYFKGGMIIYMLYCLLGEDLFDVFHEYFERYGGVPGAYNEASLEDFISVVNEQKDMRWFFDEWVYRQGLPDYELSDLSIRRKRGGYELEFDIVQKGDVYAMPIEVSVGSSTQEFWVDERAERVKMFVDELPDKIVLDPDYRIPKQNEVSLTLSRMDRLRALCNLC
jgi:aminopeptidase N